MTCQRIFIPSHQLNRACCAFLIAILVLQATPEFEEMIRMSEMIAHGTAQQQHIGPQSLSATPQTLQFPKGGIKLPLIFHIITSGLSAKDRPSDEALQAQYKAMQNVSSSSRCQLR